LNSYIGICWPRAKDKHFLVTRVITPEPPQVAIEWVEIEALCSKAMPGDVGRLGRGTHVRVTSRAY